MLRFKNIQTILFSTYSLIIIIVFAILVTWYYQWNAKLLRENAMDSLESLSHAIQEQVDNEIHKMNDISLNVMYSNLVKNRFKSYMLNMAQGHLDGSANLSPTIQSIESAKELADILTSIIGPTRPAEQLYLYDFNNTVYGNGFDNGVRKYDPLEKPWFEDVKNYDAGKYIDLPQLDEEMSKFISAREPQYSLSLFRVFYDSYNNPQGIVQVKQYYNRVFRSILNIHEESAYPISVIVYNRNGDILFPLGIEHKEYAPYTALFDENSAPYQHISLVNPMNQEEELLSYVHSPFTGWNMLFIIPENILLEPLRSFTKKMLLVALLILLFSIILSFVASKKITQPISKIHRTIRNHSLEDLGTSRIMNQKLKGGVNELDELHNSFLDMSMRLKQSMESLILSQSKELQTKLVALQSQMNPHFLYNTLATIQAMAEENLNEYIIDITENTSDLLRYITSQKSLVTIEEEIYYTKQYLEIITKRFGDKLSYTMDVDEQVSHCLVPKLIVQPLVENAIKFLTAHRPPWYIHIECKVVEHNWIIEVSDNGPGFQSEVLDELQQQMRLIDQQGIYPLLNLEGMGLLNIYTRLKIVCKESAIFQLNNHQDGGAMVTLGGQVEGGEHHAEQGYEDHRR